jgi:hypothetical protein
MISIESSEVVVDPNTFTPKMKFTFTIDLQLSGTNTQKAQQDFSNALAMEIGKEVIKQATIYHALTKED